MLLAALTGGIATGKSICADIFENLGCYIHHADQVAHELLLPHTPIWEKIKSRYSSDILNPDQTIDRKKLAEFLFASEDERKYLNSLIHPQVLQKKKMTIRSVKKKGTFPIFISEAALTIESGFQQMFDKIIVTRCPQDIQIERLCSRDQITREKAQQKIDAQMPTEEKIKYADYIIDTSGTLQETVDQTETTYRYLMQDYRLLYQD